jgi:hypothetical protein
MMIALLSTWKYSGFHVFCGNRISPDDEAAMENLARYIIRASLSQERMQYLDQEGGRPYVQRQQDKQELPRTGMAGRHVFAYPESGRANGEILCRGCDYAEY